jgi:hypothetical protein
MNGHSFDPSALAHVGLWRRSGHGDRRNRCFNWPGCMKWLSLDFTCSELKVFGIKIMQRPSVGHPCYRFRHATVLFHCAMTCDSSVSILSQEFSLSVYSSIVRRQVLIRKLAVAQLKWR